MSYETKDSGRRQQLKQTLNEILKKARDIMTVFRFTLLKDYLYC